MRIVFNQQRDRVFFHHDNAKEYKWLMEYPAFVKEGPNFTAPAKVSVVHNLIQRLKRTKLPIRIDSEVISFVNSPFKLLSLPESFKYHTKPMNYQEIALRFMYTVGSGGLLLDPGMGKSKVALDYIVLKKFKKSIVVCPKALLFVWEDEIRKHRPELSFYCVKSTDWESEKAGIFSSDVTIINYTKAVGFKQHLKTVGYDFIHLDEFLIKDPKTARTQDLTDLAYKIPYKCGGSGTLINNTVMDVFCPVRYLEPALVGFNYTKFFKQHCVTRPMNKDDPNSRKLVVAFKGKDVARSILESCSIVMTKEEWLKLPPKKFIDIEVFMSDEQRDLYYSLLRNYVISVNGEYVEVDNPLVMMSKLYQLSNGFVYSTPQDELNEELHELFAESSKSKKKSKRITHFLNEHPKIEALKTLLTKTLSGRRAIIWFNMSAEYTLIEALLNSLGHFFLTIKGGENKTGEKVTRFNEDPSIRWLVCQAKSVNYGITVLGTNEEKLETSDYEIAPGITPEVFTEIFYSLNFSLEVYLQQQDRIHRLGQEHECEYYRLITDSPIEKRIVGAIEDKLELKYEMLVDVAKSLVKETPTVLV